MHIQENLEDELVKEALEKVSRMVFLFFGKKRLGNVKEVLLKNAFVQLPFFSKMQHILSRSFNSLLIAIM